MHPFASTYGHLDLEIKLDLIHTWPLVMWDREKQKCWQLHTRLPLPTVHD